MTAPPAVGSALRVALVGNPNAGKTTLFNALTGLRQKVANYPGVTVERKEGWFQAEGREVHLMDLPGIYSLAARSPEERIASEALRGEGAGAPDLVVAIVDASNLERHLYLVTQLLGRGRPVVLALNMMDLARDRHIAIDVAGLSRELGIPVLPLAASRGEGVEALKRAIAAGASAPVLPTGLAALPAGDPRAEIQARYGWIRGVCAGVVDRRIVSPHTLTERLDAVLTHRAAGFLVFLGLMLLVFMSIFAWAKVPMDLIQSGVGAVQGLARAGFRAAGLGGGPLEGLVVDGALEGVGSVVVFLPQILILFFFIALLEDSGYMARVAFLMDRLMRGIGLHGKSFIPLMSSFACAIPGIMAARTIDNRKDRLATILVAPFMSCSARLPVYTLMIGAFIPDRKLGGLVSLAALTMLAMYLLGLGAAMVMARIFKSTLLKGPPPPFIMELPNYRMPFVRSVLLSMWDRSRLFLRRAGTVILAVSLILWFLASYPRAEGGASAPIERSFAGRMGHAMEPVIRPLGFDWRIGVGLVTSFAAREVLVSTLATIYRIEGGDGAGGRRALEKRLRDERDPATGRPAYSPLTAVSLMVFFVLACQCMSTLAVVRRETGNWGWPALMFVYMTALAYGASFAVFQVGTRMGWGTA
jgi:ferrous iron transport protein B